MAAKLATLVAQPEVQLSMAAVREAREDFHAASDVFEATLDAEQRRPFNAYSDARTHLRVSEDDLQQALVLAHAGPLAPMLRVLLEHCRDDNCDCFDAEQEGE